jgi:pimeloyl-ACP methyl ester carboxylesterase
MKRIASRTIAFSFALLTTVNPSTHWPQIQSNIFAETGEQHLGKERPQASNQISRVRSKDGTLIALECTGAGPSLIMVHGGIGDRTRWTPMFPLLSSRFTVCAMDRRGRGASGDSPNYSLKKEAEDIAAVVNSRPGKVFVLGHSYGGVVALEATFLTKRISKLILYEPPLQDPSAPLRAFAEEIEKLIEAGERERAVTTFLEKVVKLSSSEVEGMRSRPSWPDLVATIESQPRQMRALAAYKFDPGRMRTVRMPTLLLTGSETISPYLKHAISSLHVALPNPTFVVLEGQQHNAMDTGRRQLAETIAKFLLEH